MIKAHSDPRAHRRPARAISPRSRQRPIGFLMAAPRRGGHRATTAAERESDDVRARDRDARPGPSSSALDEPPTASRSTICSRARASIATKLARRRLRHAATPSAASTTSRKLPLTEKDELRASRSEAGSDRHASRGADGGGRRASSRPAAPPARRATSRSPRPTSTTGSASRRAATPPPGSSAGSASSRPTMPARSSPARRSTPSTSSASATSRSAPATPSG